MKNVVNRYGARVESRSVQGRESQRRTILKSVGENRERRVFGGVVGGVPDRWCQWIDIIKE